MCSGILNGAVHFRCVICACREPTSSPRERVGCCCHHDILVRKSFSCNPGREDSKPGEHMNRLGGPGLSPRCEVGVGGLMKGWCRAGPGRRPTLVAFVAPVANRPLRRRKRLFLAPGETSAERVIVAFRSPPKDQRTHQREICVREHRRRDPYEREEEPDRGESQKNKLQRPFPASHYPVLFSPTMKGCCDEEGTRKSPW